METTRQGILAALNPEGLQILAHRFESRKLTPSDVRPRARSQGIKLPSGDRSLNLFVREAKKVGTGMVALQVQLGREPRLPRVAGLNGLTDDMESLRGAMFPAGSRAGLAAHYSTVELHLIGVPPDPNEVARLALYPAVSFVYVGLWLSLAMFFSLVFRHVAMPALPSIAAWLFFTIFVGLLASLTAGALVSIKRTSTVAAQLAHIYLLQALQHLSRDML